MNNLRRKSSIRPSSNVKIKQPFFMCWEKFIRLVPVPHMGYAWRLQTSKQFRLIGDLIVFDFYLNYIYIIFADVFVFETYCYQKLLFKHSTFNCIFWNRGLRNGSNFFFQIPYLICISKEEHTTRDLKSSYYTLSTKTVSL